MKSLPLSRRALLRGAGGIAVALPWLEAMAPRKAKAAGPKRLVIIFTPNGTNDYAKFMPQGVGADFTLGRETDPVLPLKKDLLVVSGIDMQTANKNMDGDLHAIGMSHMLTCTRAIKADGYAQPGGGDYFVSFAGGLSIDQHIAQQLKPPTKFSTLELGVQSIIGIGPHPFSRMIYEDRLRPRPAQDDPREVFKKLFTDGTVGGAPALIDQALEQRRSVLDFVNDDYKRLRARLGASDGRKIDGHMQGIRQLELQLVPKAPGVSSCNAPADMTAALTDAALKDQKRFPEIGKLQMDLLTMALACDLTRIASLQWSWARSTTAFSWIGVNDAHHDLTHRAASPPLSEVNRWYAQQVAYQVNAMKSITEGNGTMLDSSVVLWCSDVSFGPDHKFNNIRAFLFGSCGGFFKTGQHIKLNGVPHNKLMVTLMRAMGLPAAMQFGDPTIEAGPLPGLG